MPILITDTTLRDAHQSLIATRMRTRDMLDIASDLTQHCALPRPSGQLIQGALELGFEERTHAAVRQYPANKRHVAARSRSCCSGSIDVDSLGEQTGGAHAPATNEPCRTYYPVLNHVNNYFHSGRSLVFTDPNRLFRSVSVPF